MEIRARYALIGAFTLGVIVAGFLFAYWLNTTGGLGARTSYRVRYDGPVSGLQKGSPVLFNGIRVGEVTAIALDPASPRAVVTTIAVSLDAPVRSDTKAGVEYQGLTGTPAIALVGGSAATAPAAGEGGPPLLLAEPDAGRALSDVARDAARRIDSVVKDNAEPLHKLIENIEKFADALARNSHRVDGILAGIERFTGGGAKPPVKVFDLPAASQFPAIARIPDKQLMVPEPGVINAMDSDKIYVEDASGQRSQVEGGQWPDMLGKALQARITQSFENAGYMKVVGQQSDAFTADNQLMIEVRRFVVLKAPTQKAVVELAVRLLGQGGQIVASRTFRAEEPVAAIDAASAAAGLRTAFTRLAAEVVAWTCASI